MATIDDCKKALHSAQSHLLNDAVDTNSGLVVLGAMMSLAVCEGGGTICAIADHRLVAGE
jgi:hypothetical protein